MSSTQVTELLVSIQPVMSDGDTRWMVNLGKSGLVLHISFRPTLKPGSHMRCKCKRKCKRKRRSHVDRKCKEGKICRRSQAQSKFFFKMADDSEALVAISLLFVVFLYRVLKG